MKSILDPALQTLIEQQVPAAQAAVSVITLPGLTGLSAKVISEHRVFLARREAPQPIPFISRQREFNLLKKLATSGLTPRGLRRNRQWLLMEWLDGTEITQLQLQTRLPELVSLITHLHHQPLSGYRIPLLPMLERYWQLCLNRHIGWLRALQTLQRQGEPQPLRLAMLHMDIHSGNLISTRQGLRLIDWEYAGDGDIALELAALIASNGFPAQQRDALLYDYAERNQLDERQLRRQLTRWQPWLRLLMASWFQLRAEQSQDEAMHQQARTAWQML
ncbi:thiamine kinase [[Pantoea] beijingensis]|uniref:Thiamine kinase n=1 Tax=[Pantoea] beijingensis TaxID=1324864 RepID=A0A443ICE7_9GAMM|nr:MULTISPECIES: thiamine kinase [Erwiniaceae]RWR01898.1 thiamine kinase [[Pantoea] beijingensis]